ncbi:MAG TPA: hypothetical protein VF601_15350, partial [Beijerinckiaceae bacterium]
MSGIRASLGFIRNPLDRHSAERDGAVAQHIANPEAVTIAIAGEIPILRRTGEAMTSLLALSDLDRAGARHEQAFLGTL